MGILGSVFGKTSRRISSYEIEHIDESAEGRVAAKEFSAIMDSTQSVTWDSNELKWFTYDDGVGKDDVASLVFSAAFQREYGDGTRVYLNGIEISVGITKSGSELVLNITGGDGAEEFPYMPNILIMIRAKLR